MIEIQCHLYLEGPPQVDFDEITEFLGVLPTDTRRARPRSADLVAILGEPGDGWTYKTVMVGSTERAGNSQQEWHYPTIMAGMAPVLAVVSGREDAIRRFYQERGLSLYVILVIRSEDWSLPILELSADVVGSLARLGAGFEVDPYLDVGPFDDD